MNRLLKILLAVLLTGLFSCSSDQSEKRDSVSVEPLDDFDKALSLYAQGLLAFEEKPGKGLLLLSEALHHSPYHRKMVNDYFSFSQRKVVRESLLDSQISDHEKLHTYLIETYSSVLKKFPDANYVRLKLVESFLAVDKYDEAEQYLQVEGLVEDDAVIMAKVRILRGKKSPLMAKELNKLLNNPEYRKNIQIQLMAIRYLIENGPYSNSDQLVEHAKAVIHSLPELKTPDQRDLTFTLIDAILYGSDIGEVSRNQSVDSIDYADQTSQWSLLAGILMKLDLYKEAYLVLKYRVINNLESRWRACLNLAVCCQQIGKHKERIQYLEEAYSVRPTSSYTAKSLLVSHMTHGDAERALEIYEKIGNPKDFWLQKIHFYLLKDLKRYESAFAVAEKIFEWPDPGQRITRMTVSLVTNIVPVYLKLGKPNLLDKRIAQAKKYLPGNMSLLNSLAYQFAVYDHDLDRAEKWIQEVYEKDEINSAYADTYAWVLYKKGRYKEAKVHIDKALKLEDENSSEIFLHAGDIYSKLGYRKEAEKLWQKALEADPKIKKEIEARMKTKNENSVD